MSFGATTDHWSFADTNVKLIRSSTRPAKSEAQCIDSNGDVSAATMYDCYTEYEAEYVACADAAFVLYDTATAVDFRVGKVISSKVITSVAVNTSNTARPTLVIAGQTCTTADSLVAKYGVNELEVAGTRKATAIGAIVDTNSRLLSSSATVAASVVRTLDSVGVACNVSVYGGRLDATNEFAGCAGAPGAAADTANGYTLITGPSVDQENTGYGTGSIATFKNVTKDS